MTKFRIGELICHTEAALGPGPKSHRGKYYLITEILSPPIAILASYKLRIGWLIMDKEHWFETYSEIFCE